MGVLDPWAFETGTKCRFQIAPHGRKAEVFQNGSPKGCRFEMPVGLNEKRCKCAPKAPIYNLHGSNKYHVILYKYTDSI